MCGCKRSRAQLGQRLGSPRKRPKAKWPLSLLALKTAESPPWRATSTAEVVAMTCVCTRIHVCTHAIRRSSQPTCTYDVHVFRCFTPRPNPVMARMSGEARMVSKPWIVLQRRAMRTCAPTSWGTATANGASAASGRTCPNRARERTRKAGGLAKPERIPVRAETTGRPLWTRGGGPCTPRRRPGMPATAQPIPWDCVPVWITKSQNKFAKVFSRRGCPGKISSAGRKKESGAATPTRWMAGRLYLSILPAGTRDTLTETHTHGFGLVAICGIQFGGRGR